MRNLTRAAATAGAMVLGWQLHSRWSKFSMARDLHIDGEPLEMAPIPQVTPLEAKRQETYEEYLEFTKALVRACAVYERALSESAHAGCATRQVWNAIQLVGEVASHTGSRFPIWLLPDDDGELGVAVG